MTTKTEIVPITNVAKDKDRLWPKLHDIINNAYTPPTGHESTWPLSQPFYRLHPDRERAWAQFNEELGVNALVALAFLPKSSSESNSATEAETIDPQIPDHEANGHDDGPKLIACAAIMPIPMNPLKSSLIQASLGLPPDLQPTKWEFNFVITAPSHRGQGLSSGLVRDLEAEATRLAPGGCARMTAMTVDDVSGEFWRRIGYRKVDELSFLIKKGFTHLEGYNGLPGDLFLWGGEKWVEDLERDWGKSGVFL